MSKGSTVTPYTVLQKKIVEVTTRNKNTVQLNHPTKILKHKYKNRLFMAANFFVRTYVSAKTSNAQFSFLH